ncbi:hypothetical protein VPH35_098601 [Triticum aestivum]
MASLEQDPRHRQIQGRHVSTGSSASREASPSHQDDASQTGKRIKKDLPEDIWLHICSFLPMKDAARAACVSRAFRSSWKCRPNLSFCMETLGYNVDARRQSKLTRDYNSKVSRILRSHSGVGVKTLHLEFYGPYDGDTNSCLDSCLQTAIAPGIEGLSLRLLSPEGVPFYKEPNTKSHAHSYLMGCAFHPTVGSGCMRSLTNLSLSFVHITGDELGFLLSGSFALEQLELSCCREINSLNIPCLQRLRCLRVFHCDILQVIESKAPNISSFHFHGDQQVQLLLGESLQLKKIFISHSCVLSYARSMLPSTMPNLENLTVYSVVDEVYSPPMLPRKFLHLKYLDIKILRWTFPTACDILLFISFLDACPCLETFNLNTPMWQRDHDDSIVEDTSHLGRIPGRYDNLRHVKLTSFYSTNLLVQLTCHILEHTPSLECLTLDITDGWPRCSDKRIGKCYVSRATLVEAPKTLEAIRTCIEGKVPSTVKLNVLKPCNRCHDVDY